VLRQPREQWGHNLIIKRNIPMILANELKKKKPGVVGISTVTDAYQPVEHHYRLTRFCLEQLFKYDFPVHIQTKSARVVRDIDLLRRFSDSQVMFSIGTLHDHERLILEAGASSIQERIQALKQCSEANLKTAVFFGPVYPTTRAEDIPRFLDIIMDAGAQEIWIDMLRLRPGILEQIQKTTSSNSTLLHQFSKPLSHYQTIREEIKKQGNKRNLRIIDAF
jgi:DNA repair photolyase